MCVDENHGNDNDYVNDDNEGKNKKMKKMDIGPELYVCSCFL